MTPVPIMLRPAKIPGNGTAQSETWKAMMRPVADADGELIWSDLVKPGLILCGGF